MIRRAALLALLTTMGACVQSTPEPLAAASSAGAEPRGIYYVVEPEARSTRFGPGPRHRIIYMNRKGGTYTRGNDNSVNNTTIVPSQTSQLSAWSYGDAAWAQLMGCVKLQYARFDVEITDVEPSPQTVYIESAVGGTPQEMGQPNGVGGVAPVAGDCSVVERAIAFTFSDVYNGRIQQICETVAQETSHAFGLDHEILCEDPMTYLGGCGAKTFQDKDAQCGERDGPRTCQCGDETQNSVQTLFQVLGPADSQAPEISITEPANSAEVAPGFAISGDASDNAAVTKVDLFIDDQLITSDASAPYEFSAPASLASGSHKIELRAYDAGGSVGSASVTVQLEGGSEPPPGGTTPPGGGTPPGGSDDPGSGAGSDPGTDPGDDGAGGPQNFSGGCSAAPAHDSESGGVPALLLVLAALVLAYRRRLG